MNAGSALVNSDGNLADQISLPAPSGGLTWDTSLLPTQGVISVMAITIVPEPTRALLMMGGVAMMMFRRRRD